MKNSLCVTNFDLIIANCDENYEEQLGGQVSFYHRIKVLWDIVWHVSTYAVDWICCHMEPERRLSYAHWISFETDDANIHQLNLIKCYLRYFLLQFEFDYGIETAGKVAKLFKFRWICVRRTADGSKRILQ